MRLYIREHNEVIGYITFKPYFIDRIQLIYKYMYYKRLQFWDIIYNTESSLNSKEMAINLAYELNYTKFLQLLHNDHISFIYVPLKPDDILMF